MSLSPNIASVPEAEDAQRSGPPTDGNVDPVNEGDVTNNISFLRLC
ncbi:hypothetical protein PENANT_c029G03323 [Penicillium antarcticum]|uniref:Uncharacterized protein n=1 Tax=Penicillium antarcticum TaxID=416450 RepID=A0A1V6PWQ7_9EURO|nr:hypothetical protein PENANT_c029G03323 [Penicillium antarcticum]